MRLILSLVLFAAFFCITSAVAQEPDAAGEVPGVLFSSHELLNMTIEAPFRSVFRQRGQDSDDHDAVLRYDTPGGGETVLDIEVRTRGKFRLKRSTCRFPPIRLDIKTSKAENTLFAGEDKLKLVTHCQDNRSDYEQYVLKEYLVYRIFNLLTDMSFQVRLARVTYTYTDDDRDSLTRYAFLIEDEDHVALRNGWEALEVVQVQPAYYDQAQLNLVEIFEYMIGNTDWDAFKSAPDEDDCCHNVKVVGHASGPVFPVPYDFDFSGIVDARYATPDPSLGIRHVRQRQYRGICKPRETIDATLQVFFEHEDAIYDLYRQQEGLEERTVERSIDYIEEFYEIIRNPRSVRSRIERDCRRGGGGGNDEW